MAVFSYTQTDVILGKLTNGMKIVLTTVTNTDGANSGITAITVRPLSRITAFTVGLAIPLAFDYIVAAHATQPNALNITPSAAANTSVLKILSVGV
jgi:hypothetical protein